MAGVNDSQSFSTAGYGQLRIREGVVYRYYNDLGPHSGNCTWGLVRWLIMAYVRTKN